MDLPDRGLISADRRHVVPAGPKVLAREVLPPPEVGPRNVDGTLPLDESEDLGHGVLRGNGQQHVHMVEVEMPLLQSRRFRSPTTIPSAANVTSAFSLS